LRLCVENLPMAFRTKLKVRFGNIDHVGIVYYPRFLHSFHVALEEFLDIELGSDDPTSMNTRRIVLATVYLETDFSQLLLSGDRIEVGGSGEMSCS
jgi:acyl-CoA thioesterase FadM